MHQYFRVHSLPALPAVVAVEVIGVIGVILEQERLLLNDGVTLLTDVLSQSPSLLSVVAGTTQMPARKDRVTEIRVQTHASCFISVAGLIRFPAHCV